MPVRHLLTRFQYPGDLAAGQVNFAGFGDRRHPPVFASGTSPLAIGTRKGHTLANRNGYLARRKNSHVAKAAFKGREQLYLSGVIHQLHYPACLAVFSDANFVVTVVNQRRLAGMFSHSLHGFEPIAVRFLSVQNRNNRFRPQLPADLQSLMDGNIYCIFISICLGDNQGGCSAFCRPSRKIRHYCSQDTIAFLFFLICRMWQCYHGPGRFPLVRLTRNGIWILLTNNIQCCGYTTVRQCINRRPQRGYLTNDILHDRRIEGAPLL